MHSSIEGAEMTEAVLLPYQVDWVCDRSRVKVIEKSRRIGITWATACHAVLQAAEGKHDVWYVSYTANSAKEFIVDCVKWAASLGIAANELGEVLLPVSEDGEAKGQHAYQLVVPKSGKRITALTSSARSLRGKAGIVIVDEAAFHDHLKEVLKAAFALLMWGGEVWIMSTHNGVDNHFNELCEGIRDGKLPYALHRTTITDALGDGLYRRICAVSDPPEDWSSAGERAWLDQLEREYGDGVREELYCEPARGGASYIGRPLIEARMVRGRPVLRLERPDAWVTSESPEARRAEVAEWCDATLAPLLSALPQHLPHGMGFDFGRYSDRSVIAPFTLCQDLERSFPFLVELLCIPHEQQWQILKYVGSRLPGFFSAVLDAGGNGSWVAEKALEHWGSSAVQCVQLSLRWYAENMPPFREAHERALISYPSDIDVRNDVALIRRIDGVPMLPKDRTEATSNKKKRHGDAAIALVLAYAASREAEQMRTRWDGLAAS
jgi:phage FluMu gp28-like protein